MPHEPDLLDTEEVYYCWLVWKLANDGGRPYLVAVDTTEAKAKIHKQSVEDEARFVYKLDERMIRSLVQVEQSFLNHAYGETMGQGYDRIKARAQEVRRATLDELEKANKLLAQKETEIKALQTELETLKASIREQETEQEHTDSFFKCPYCGQTFEEERHLDQHLDNDHPKQIDPSKREAQTPNV